MQARVRTVGVLTPLWKDLDIRRYRWEKSSLAGVPYLSFHSVALSCWVSLVHCIELRVVYSYASPLMNDNPSLRLDGSFGERRGDRVKGSWMPLGTYLHTARDSIAIEPWSKVNNWPIEHFCCSKLCLSKSVERVSPVKRELVCFEVFQRVTPSLSNQIISHCPRSRSVYPEEI